MAIRSGSSPTRSRCSPSSCSSATASGWRRRAGGSWPWATAWRGLVGQLAGGPRLPWNPRKGWAGLVAFVLFGAAAAAFLSAWAARLPLDADALHWPRTVGTALALAAVCALVESLPTTLDDNVTVPLATMLTLPLIASAEPVLLAADPGLGRRVLVGLALNGALGLAAYWRARSTSRAPCRRC